MYLCVHKKATNIACRGELGKFPLIISIHKRIIKYVAKINSLPNSAIAKQAFLISKDLYINNKPSLHTNLMKILKLYDSSTELNALDNISPPQISLYIQNAKDKYINFWKHKQTNSSKLSFLSTFKCEYQLEEYL
jgi:hypothetical protein